MIVDKENLSDIPEYRQTYFDLGEAVWVAEQTRPTKGGNKIPKSTL